MAIKFQDKPAAISPARSGSARPVEKPATERTDVVDAPSSHPKPEPKAKRKGK